MARTTTRPKTTVQEEIHSVEEHTPAARNGIGIVRVMVGVVDAKGIFRTPQQFQLYTIEGEDYTELCGPPPAWAPDKPTGTYRNEDLWHFVDAIRARK